ncbi:hypothetical protein V1525DRAFT_419532 [Lipomyces kononenkoae]|uniref:Uncharacterized protein n=1 Tax=Lipomyces kononenkoae TaxID=34357 RepID=A0ACC3T0M8_LIPKO
MSTVLSSSELALKRIDSTLSSATTLADVTVPVQSHLTTSVTLDTPTTTAAFAYDYRTDKEQGEETLERRVPKKILGLRARIFWILTVSLIFLVVLIAVLVVAIVTRKSTGDSSNSNGSLPYGTDSHPKSVYMKRLIDGGIIL